MSISVFLFCSHFTHQALLSCSSCSLLALLQSQFGLGPSVKWVQKQQNWLQWSQASFPFKTNTAVLKAPAK